MTPTVEDKSPIRNQSRAAEFRALLGTRVLVADGAMATALFAKGVLPNRCLEELNVSLPAMVRDVHRESMRAGAEILETNTFGANRTRLATFGLPDRVGRFNHAAVRIAREAAAGAAFVAGVIGPLGQELEPLGPVSAEDARAIFREQASALVAAGVDLLILETFQYLNELTEAVAAAREAAGPELVIVAQIAVSAEGLLPDGTSAAAAAKIINELEADAAGINCGTGPKSVYDAFVQMAHISTKPLSVMPVAGQSSPEYFAQYARRFADAGASIVGGCCMTTADHIFAVKGAVDDLPVVSREVLQFTSDPVAQRPPRDPSKLVRMLAAKQFVLLAEASAPRIGDRMGDVADDFKKSGVDAVAVSGGPNRIPAVAACQGFQHGGIETVLLSNFRGVSSGQLRSELMGVTFAGVQNVIARPDEAAAVVSVAQSLGWGTVVGAEIPLRGSLEHLSGAAFLVTHPVFSVAEAEQILERVRPLGLPVIVAVRPLQDVLDAEYVREELRLAVPDSVIEQLRAQPDSGPTLASDLALQLKPQVAGIRVEGPNPQTVLAVVREIRRGIA